MLRKKLILGMLSAAVVSSLVVSQVQAAPVTGDTDVTYKAGTVGPIDPVDPQNPDKDQNNWMVYYPKTVTLTDNNKIEKANYKNERDTKAQKLKFKVQQKIAGTDGNYDVNEGNVGNGIKVKASAGNDVWAANSDEIKMKQGNANPSDQVIMGLGNENNLIIKEGELLTLTQDKKEDNGYAVLTKTVGAVDGLDYTAKLTFTFERQQ